MSRRPAPEGIRSRTASRDRRGVQDDSDPENPHVQLFHQLAPRGVEQGLTAFQLSAGKMELGRPLVYLVAVEPGVYEPVFPCYVVGDRPEQLAFELMADAPGVDVATQPADPLLNIGLKAYATRAVKQRLHQRRFRYAVLRAYRTRCAMCQLKHERLLDAAHILEDRDERGLPEVPNGLALCRIHHGAYDVGIIGVDPKYGVHVREDVLEEHDGPMLRYGLQEMHGGVIQVPRPEGLRPNREFLAERFERFRAA